MCFQWVQHTTEAYQIITEEVLETYRPSKTSLAGGTKALLFLFLVLIPLTNTYSPKKKDKYPTTLNYKNRPRQKKVEIVGLPFFCLCSTNITESNMQIFPKEINPMTVTTNQG